MTGCDSWLEAVAPEELAAGEVQGRVGSSGQRSSMAQRPGEGLEIQEVSKLSCASGWGVGNLQ